MTIFSLKHVLSCIALSGVMFLGQGCSENISDTPVQVKPETRQLSSEAVMYKSALEKRLQAGNGIGLSVAIIDKDQEDIVTIGLADRATDRKIDTETLFEIGSITKTFTGILLADMVLKGEVKLDDPASKYLPESVKLPEYQGKKITLKDLATHTSALPPMPSNFNPADHLNPYADYTPELMYDFLSSYALERPIGEVVEYSNLGMGLLGHIFELKTGKSYEQLVTERILQPLAMSDSFITIPTHKTDHFAVGHDTLGNPTRHWDIPTLAGAGAFRSDISDMTIFLKANMGLIETPLAGALEMSHKFQHKMGEDGSYIGLAWITQNMDGKNVTWHNGGTGGFRTFLGFDPDNRRGTIVLANAQDNPDLIGRAILTNKPELLEPPKADESLKFSSEQLERFVGDYQIVPEFIISITREDDQLFVQATGQQKFPVFAKSEMEFILKVVEASVIFEENEAGEIVKLSLNQGGILQPAPKL